MTSVSRTPTLEELISIAIDSKLQNVHTALPGKVESYDSLEQKADIKPLVKRTIIIEDNEEITEPFAVIPDVPIVFPRAGGFFISFPIQVGDFVLLVFNERSIDKFMVGDGADTDPVDIRIHDLSDAVAIPGLYPFQRSLSDAHGSNLVIGEDGGSQIHLRPDGEIHLGSDGAADFVALAQKVLTELQSIKTVFDAHVHPVTTAPGTTGQTATSIPAPGSVAATKVKAD